MRLPVRASQLHYKNGGQEYPAAFCNRSSREVPRIATQFLLKLDTGYSEFVTDSLVTYQCCAVLHL
jgi:hypothetical protein